MYDFNQFANPSYLCRLAWEAVISVFNSSSTLAAQRCLIYYLWINNNWNRKCIQNRYLVSGQKSNFTCRRRWCQNIEMLIGKKEPKHHTMTKRKKKYKCHFFNACKQINYVLSCWKSCNNRKNATFHSEPPRYWILVLICASKMCPHFFKSRGKVWLIWR